MKTPFFIQSRHIFESLQARFTSEAQRLKFIETYQFPAGLKTKFARLHASLTPGERERIFAALRDYFIICQQSRKTMVSMPSQIVDEAWHEFILFTRDYNDFCLKAFGCYLHHTPAEAMQSKFSAQNGIKRVWRLACLRENIDPQQPDRLPLIFAIDGMLAIPHGFIYSLDCMGEEKHEFCATHIGCATYLSDTPGAYHDNSHYGNSDTGSWSGDTGSHADSSAAGSDCGSYDGSGSDCGGSDSGGSDSGGSDSAGSDSGGSDCGPGCGGHSCGGHSCGGSSCGGSSCGGGGCGGGGD